MAAVAAPHVAAAEKYCREVLSGLVPACKWVRLACARQVEDRKREKSVAWPYRFDKLAAERVCRFIGKMPHVKGPKAGTCIHLEPWQCFLLTTVFGWLQKQNGKRRFRRAYSEMPRGQGKSAISSGIGLYMTAMDGEGGAEVYSLATNREQARIVFRDAQAMARKTPEFRERHGVEVLAHAIVQVDSGSRFEALSADANSLDGLNVHCGIIDELHAHRTRAVYDVVETATGKRDQSLLWVITTAGTDRSGICYEVRSYLTKILDGVFQDESVFGVIYTIDDSDDWADPATWRKANPNWGVSVMPDVVGQLAAKALQLAAAQPNFLTKHLCVWVNADVAWMDMRAWDRCADPTLDEADFADASCIVGLDLASKTDIAARIDLYWREVEGRRHYWAFGRYYLNEAAVTEGRNSQYQGWEIDGRLIVTPGNETDFGRIQDDLLSGQGKLEIAYDPWQATQLGQNLQAAGAKAVEYRNTVATFSAPMKEIDAAVRSGRFHHNGCPVLTWMISNVVCHVDAKDNIYPRKERAENKIDGVVALITAIGRAMAATEAPKYELLFF